MNFRCEPGIVFTLTFLLSFIVARGSTSICSSFSYSCAILESGEVKCWGKLPDGYLGPWSEDIGDEPNEMGKSLPPLGFGQNSSALKLSCQQEHACVLFEDGDIKCWGTSYDGALGAGSKVKVPVDLETPPIDLGLRGDVEVQDVCVGRFNSCALLNNGEVKCWGSNGNGYTGPGQSKNLGRAPREVGDTFHTIDFGKNRTAIQMSCGWYHACALLDNQRVKCWGRNSDLHYTGYLGIDSRELSIGNFPNSMGDNLPFVDLGINAPVAQISAALDFSCALLVSGEIKCWGNGEFGQLGQGNNRHIVGLSERDQMGDSLAAIDIGTNRAALEIVTGDYHVCAILNEGSVLCWGHKYAFGSEKDIGDCVSEIGNNLAPIDLGTKVKVIQLSASTEHTCALLDTRELKCWGYGDYGKLGQGSTTSYGDASVGRMGDGLPPIDLGGLVKMPALRFTFSPIPDPRKSPSFDTQLLLVLGTSTLGGAFFAAILVAFMCHTRFKTKERVEAPEVEPYS